MKTIKAETIGHGFKELLHEVLENGEKVGSNREIRNAIVEFETVKIDAEIDKVVREVLGSEHVDDTIDWTFPKNPSTGLTGEISAKEYRKEQYFYKLIECDKGNQLEQIVDDIDNFGRVNRAIAQAFKVDKDMKAMFPPCLLDIQAMYRNGEINLNGHYRSHTLAKSYYGDVVGLKRIMEWLAEQLDVGVGFLTVFSASAHVRRDKNYELEKAKEIHRRLE